MYTIKKAVLLIISCASVTLIQASSELVVVSSELVDSNATKLSKIVAHYYAGERPWLVNKTSGKPLYFLNPLKTTEEQVTNIIQLTYKNVLNDSDKARFSYHLNIAYDKWGFFSAAPMDAYLDSLIGNENPGIMLLTLICKKEGAFASWWNYLASERTAGIKIAYKIIWGTYLMRFVPSYNSIITEYRRLIAEQWAAKMRSEDPQVIKAINTLATTLSTVLGEPGACAIALLFRQACNMAGEVKPDDFECNEALSRGLSIGEEPDLESVPLPDHK